MLLALAATALAGPTASAQQLLPSDVAQDSGYMPFGSPEEGARLFYLLQERDSGAK